VTVIPASSPVIPASSPVIPASSPVIPAKAGIQGSRRVSLLGAESTGKTQLAQDLAQHLTSLGLRAVAVPEFLRTWCQSAGRAPRPEEQLAIAQEHERLVDKAAESADIVIADTTALMVAIYAGMLFEEGELFRFAIERQRGYQATLVTGLDLPWVADGMQRDAAHPRDEVDTLVRSLLQRAGNGYQVVYGQGAQRLQGAVAALRSARLLPASAQPAPEGDRPWAWNCEKCSDPDCEHRLFTRLVKNR
jgi:nicotinamide riboside kinase